MRVFIAGATGVVGARTVALLVAAGHEVTGLARSAEKAGLLQRQGARAVQASLFDPDALGRAVAGHDAVVNLATHIPVGSAAISARAWREDDQIRTEGSRILVDAALDCAPGIYNVAEPPVRRSAWAAAIGAAAGTGPAKFYPALLQKLAGPRAEPLTRSQRVDSSRFAAATGWVPASRSTQGSWSGQPITAEA
jgi:nucleoside-diphosphate-sugar epimerase